MPTAWPAAMSATWAPKSASSNLTSGSNPAARHCCTAHSRAAEPLGSITHGWVA